MKQYSFKTLAFLLAFAGLLSSCATFSIKNTSVQDGRENREYRLLVDASDKKAETVSVVFVYRINSGEWKEIPGLFNGTNFEALVPASELRPGTLEYYAWMINAKGKKVSSKPARIPVYTYEQAKSKAQKSYAARLSDGGSPAEFIWNESAFLKLRIAPAGSSETQEPASVECTVVKADGTLVLQAQRESDSLFTVPVNAPHSGSSLSHQWRVRWVDSEFGDITALWPQVPASVPVLDQLALNQRISTLFAKSLVHYKNVAGSYFDPPVVEASLLYDPLLAKYSAGNSSVFLVIHRGPWSARIRMNETADGYYRVGIPVRELEAGPVTYSFEFSDVFEGPGLVSAEYPKGKKLPVSYRTYGEILKETVANIRSSLSHTPPADAFEQKPLQFVLNANDPAVSIESVRLDGSGFQVPGGSLIFAKNGSVWTAGLPGAFVRSGPAAYRLIATVRDSRFGKIEVILPGSDFYTLNIQSLAALKSLREQELARALFHAAPSAVLAGEPISLSLSLSSSSAIPVVSASLFFRTDVSPRFREIRGQPVSGSGGGSGAGTGAGSSGFLCTIAGADTNAAYIQYYFVVTAQDPVAGLITVSVKDQSSGGTSDFVVAP